ncbi:MAG TPA: hypothetical protein VN715_22905 [Roseiarcus sp.]|nr:hypothetical protein [Roseiarcus sp.]
MRHHLLAIALALAPTLAHAECMPLHDFIKQETAGPDKYVDTFSFRRDHRADNVLMLLKNTTQRGHLPERWLFLHRNDPQSAAYCVVSRGVTFGQHQDMPENASGDNFGAPGSGLPRCSAGGKAFTAEEQLRDWANRELGSSSILYTASPDGPGFQFLIADNQDWIIIEDDRDQSCFYARGTDLMLRFNTTLINP